MHGKIYRWEAAVQIRHRTEGTRLACASNAALRRAFAAAWEMVSLALTILFDAANLAEVARFACVTLRKVADTSGAIWFAIRSGSAEIIFQGVETGTPDGQAAVQPREQDLLQRIQAILIDSITVTAPIPA